MESRLRRLCSRILRPEPNALGVQSEAPAAAAACVTTAPGGRDSETPLEEWRHAYRTENGDA